MSESQASALTPLLPQDVKLAIETVDLTRDFGQFRAVDHLNLRVEVGRFHGFLGSGKLGGKLGSTLFIIHFIDDSFCQLPRALTWYHPPVRSIRKCLAMPQSLSSSHYQLQMNNEQS